MLTKLQIAFGVAAGLAILVFGAGMVSNVNVARVPGWLAPLAWGTFGLVVVSCIGVATTLVLDREKESPSDEEKAEKSPADEQSPGQQPAEESEVAPQPTDLEQIEADAVDAAAFEPGTLDVVEPAGDETVEFTSLPLDE
jgi:hypothetical protein